MAIINSVTKVLHRIRVKLYPNYLAHVEGAYIARTDNEAAFHRGSLRGPEEPGRVKVGGHLAENGASKLIGVLPALGAGKWQVEVKTQFSGSGSTLLKAPGP
jgi:hypothetical protein